MTPRFQKCCLQSTHIPIFSALRFRFKQLWCLRFQGEGGHPQILSACGAGRSLEFRAECRRSQAVVDLRDQVCDLSECGAGRVAIRRLQLSPMERVEVVKPQGRAYPARVEEWLWQADVFDPSGQGAQGYGGTKRIAERQRPAVDEVMGEKPNQRDDKALARKSWKRL